MKQPNASLEQRHDALDAELSEILGRREGLLYDMMLYQLGWVDKLGEPLPRSRPLRPYSTLCLLSCEAVGGDYRPALSAAAALELVNAFILVHKDVQDGSPHDDSRPSVWWVWGPGQAINVGDGLHALGRSALFRLSDAGLPPGRVLKALNILDEACLQLCEGQYLDLSYQERLDVPSSAYLRMAEGMTGAITAGAMALGALAATGDREIVDAFHAAGLKLGVAYQIRRDIQALWGAGEGGAPSPQILNKNKTYPVVLLLETADLKTKRRLGGIYFKRVLEPSDAADILALLEEAGARQSAESAVRNYCRQSMEALERLSLPQEGLQGLARMAECITGDRPATPEGLAASQGAHE